jgi:GNAT superfamily N-acetyltransferase
MIRKANLNDLDAIEDAYNEHFQYEIDHQAYTVFKKGVYPTRADAERAIGAGAMFIYEENGLLCGSLILDKKQPVEYANILWKVDCAEREVMVIHLLMVRPQMSGRGIGSALIKYAVEFARNDGCKALRLDTGGQNIPAVALYEKNEFDIIMRAPKKVGDVIAHENHLFLERGL